MPQEQAGINLLPTSQVEHVRINPYVTWFINYGYYLLAISYVVILGVLGTRWFLDMRLTSINNSIEEKVQTIQASQEFLEEYKRIQESYVLASTMFTKYDEKFEYLELIEQSIPEPITLGRVTAAGKQIIIEGTTLEYLAISQWQYDLAQTATVKSASVTQIERTPIADSTDEQTEQVQFTLEVDMK